MEVKSATFYSPQKNDVSVPYNTFQDIKNGIINSINSITNNEEKEMVINELQSILNILNNIDNSKEQEMEQIGIIKAVQEPEQEQEKEHKQDQKQVQRRDKDPEDEKGKAVRHPSRNQRPLSSEVVVLQLRPFHNAIERFELFRI